MKINIKDKLIIIIGSAIVAFAICNILLLTALKGQIYKKGWFWKRVEGI